MAIVLKKGSWRQFKIFLLLKGYSSGWDSNISQKIFMILQGEELRKRYLSGFPALLPSEKLDLALDDIINPLEILEELGGPVPREKAGWRQAYMENYHPGRLTLNPDAYHHAYTESTGLGKDHVCKVLELGFHTSFLSNLEEGGSFCEGYSCPPREGDPHPGKHRLLDRPERRTEDPSKAASRAWAGLQDTYFLGGLPLIFWSRKRGNSMGMRVSTEEFYQPFDSANNRTVHVADFQRGRVAGFQWRSSKDLSEYERMWYLPTEGEYRGVHRSLVHDEYLRTPRTYRSGAQPWIDRHAGGKTPVDKNFDGCTDAYIHHIQRIEDIDRAHALGWGWNDRSWYMTCGEGVQIKTLGGW